MDRCYLIDVGGVVDFVILYMMNRIEVLMDGIVRYMAVKNHR